jgi:hypothetical protein
LAGKNAHALPPEVGSATKQTLMKYRFQPKDGADQYGQSLPLVLSDLPDPGAANNIFILDALSITPRKVDGRIYFSKGKLAGKVVDYLTGKPIFGAAVTADPGGFSAPTKADGSFLIDPPDPVSSGIPPGAYSVGVQKSGYYPGRTGGEVAGKDATTDIGTIALFPVPANTGGFRRGYVNGDGVLDISDGIALLAFLFQGATVVTCLDAADVNDDGTLDLSDAISIFGYLFMGAAAPHRPFVLCGPDPTEDSLDCSSSPGC